MNELFYDNGHLTDDALCTLISGGPLSELERLEISEHMSFCDACVAKYVDCLEDSLLLSPIEPVTSSVMKRIRERTRRIFANKYATVIAAACFAIVFWNIGLFHIDILDNGKVLNRLSDEAVSFSERTERVSAQLSETLDKFISSFSFERGINYNEKK